MMSSTPNTSRELCDVRLNNDSDVIAVNRSSSPPIVVSEGSGSSLGLGAVDATPRFHLDLKPAALDTDTDANVDVKPKCQSRSCSVNLNDSVGSSLGAGSAGSAAGEARSRCLENKLAATLQVLKNKEETVRVQAESLALAEARIAALTARAPPRPAAPATPSHHALHSTRSSADGCCVETSDVTAQTQEEDEVVTLRDNLSIIEDLYRDCFYESCKQEEVIDVLRASCLAVRRRERGKDARIAHLQRALHAHGWPLQPLQPPQPLHRCQDIALEVENLKSEISNFLNSSNHDSGMWERAEGEGVGAGELADDLQHIARQLLQLRELLAEGCSCGLEDENMKLKKINEKLELELGALEAALQDKENLARQHQQQILLKDQQLESLQQQVAALEAAAADHRSTCDDLHLQVQQLQAELQERSEQCGQLRRDLDRTRAASKEESEAVRAEVSALSGAVGRWRAQLAAGRRRLQLLEDRLRGERERCAHLDHHYQEKARQAAALQTALEEAHARGAALCHDSQRALCGVRRWMRRARYTHREQEQTIEEQKQLIRMLQQRQSDADSEPCCSRALRARETANCWPAPRTSASETACCSPVPRAGASETASCSRCRSVRTSVSDTSGRSAPTPPRRAKRKPSSEDRECQCGARCDASCQRPARADAHTRTSLDALTGEVSATGEVSPAEEMLEVLQRVERAHAALGEARRRWRRDPRAEPS